MLQSSYNQNGVKWREQFEKLDENGEGILYLDEVQNVIETNQFNQIIDPELVQQVPKDGAGTLDQDEFVDLMLLLEQDI